MVLKKSRAGLYYACEKHSECKTTHSAHADGRPMGVPADSETRNMRKKAHDAFDLLWKSGMRTRAGAYTWLAKRLGLKPDETHMGVMNAAMCQRVIDEIAKVLPSTAAKNQ